MDKQVFNQEVIPLFVLCLLIATFGVGVGFFIPAILLIPIVIAEFIILIAAVVMRKKHGIPKGFLFLFVFLTGITTAPIVYWAGISGGIELIFKALALTVFVFGGLAFYVYKTGKDFRSWGVFLFTALIGLIIASVVNFFVGGSTFTLVLDVGVLLVFLGLVMYDMSKILRDYSNNRVTDAVLTLYLDFLNIFIRILRLLGGRKR